MPIFEEVVRLAGQNSGLQALRPVVEKELLHHEILRTMAEAGLLHQLTFIGGTCLRAGGRLASLADVAIRVPATRTCEVQELHLPAYHCLCLLLEDRFYADT
jgi:hypothetical protein